MHKTAVVTGAGGYIGRHVVRSLLDRGFSVGAVDPRLDGVDARAEWLEVDIFSGAPDVSERMGRPDVVLHLAWLSGYTTAILLPVMRGYPWRKCVITVERQWRSVTDLQKKM